MTRKDLRRAARNQLHNGIFQDAWLLALVACLLVNVVSGVFIVGFILAGPLAFGLSYYFLALGRKAPTEIGHVFKGIQYYFADTFLLWLLKTLFLILWTLLLIIPGIIKGYSYALAEYIQVDDENKDWKHCIDESRRMMDGHKWELFVLDLSFIGWYIVGLLCLFVGVLWVIPYHEAAKANFYRVLKGEPLE